MLRFRLIRVNNTYSKRRTPYVHLFCFVVTFPLTLVCWKLQYEFCLIYLVNLVNMVDNIVNMKNLVNLKTQQFQIMHVSKKTICYETPPPSENSYKTFLNFKPVNYFSRIIVPCGKDCQHEGLCFFLLFIIFL